MTETESNNKTKKTIPERELVGIKRPALYGDGFNLRKEAALAFEAMLHDAEKDGIRIYSVSSYRSFDRQRRIWNRKYRSMNNSDQSPAEKVRKILTYSSLPGSSRHHWGTDADLIDLSIPQPDDVLLPRHFKKGGVYHKLYMWLKENAQKFDFYEVYTDDKKRTGYKYEPWHWSYAPLSIPFTEQFMEMDLRKYVNIAKMEGREIFSETFIKQFKEEWGLGIHPKLIPESYKNI